ncbi:RNA ligase [Gammaproteobacteria bacterium]
MSERKLATIQRISKLTPIENAEQIVVASVLGWKVVVRKDEFKEGDLVCYCEIDSILPEKSEFEFLRQKKFRIRTAKFRNQISQGICFPLSILPEGTEIVEGKDVTDILGVTKYIYQIPAHLEGIIKGEFPQKIVPKTDETRVQLLQEVLTRHKGTRCYISEKVDGSSVTYYYKDGNFGVCSRNLELKESEDNTLWKQAKELKIKEKLEAYGKNLSLQGEIIGNGIQKNPLRLDGVKVLFFSVFDCDAYKYLDFEEFRQVIELLGLETVPIVDTNFELIDDIDELVKIATSNSKINPKIYREGIVIRPLKEIMDMQMAQGFGNGRLSMKIVNPEYLLKFDA